MMPSAAVEGRATMDHGMGVGVASPSSVTHLHEKAMEQEDLRNLERQCIQEEPPTCVAACPIHVDARAMAAAVAGGDFTEAAKIFKKTAPFPGIISRVCDQPCREVCRRGEAGAPIAIRALERACLDWAEEFQTRVLPVPGKDKTVAVVGAGLSGLTAALDLARKGYAVRVFEKSGRLGGSLWNLKAEDLPKEVMAADFEALSRVGVTMELNTEIGGEIPLLGLLENHDAVYLAPGAQSRELFGLKATREGRVEVDAVTIATSEKGIFAGGSLLRAAGAISPILSISDGRRAAISIDRYLQRVSLTASRVREGGHGTRLFTSLKRVPALPQVPMGVSAEGYSKEEAVAEAKRCIQCQCLECVKVCEYLNSFRSYPRRYIREIYNNLAIVMGQRHANKLINSCSLCGLCREVCPEGLHMGLVCKAAREEMVRAGRMPPSAHDFPIRDMAFSNGDQCAMLRHEPGSSHSEYLFYPGCQLSGSRPDQVLQVYALLRHRLSGGVGIALGCCGAPAEWSGRVDLFRETRDLFAQQHVEMGCPKVILACSTCHALFKTHLPDIQIETLWEVFDRMGIPESTPPPTGSPLAIHDPCTTRHESHIQETVRRLLNRLGVEAVELPLSRDRTECCGYGGLMFFANRDLARAVIDRRIKETSLDFVAYCAICRDFIASRGKPTVHLLDLILGCGAGKAARRKPPGYSQRHENRVRLKRALLREVWGEDVVQSGLPESIRLEIPDALSRTLEERLILEEDIRQVIDHAERTGLKLLNPDTGHLLAHHKPASVTYWVEYSRQEETYVIHNAYSHRMEIVEETRP